MPSRFFPEADQSSADGLVGVGGQLSVEWLLDAYRHGIFPWPGDPDDPMLWWSPDPRAILPLDGVHVSHRLHRTLRSGKFMVACNTAFEQVLQGCATGPGRQRGTWLNPQMIDAYAELHRQGHAHCVESWHNGELAGGVYGVAIGGLFAAESMFYRVRDASKVALVCLTGHLQSRGYRLLDIQQWTPHTGSLGAVTIPRKSYLQQVASIVDLPITFGNRLEGDAARTS